MIIRAPSHLSGEILERISDMVEPGIISVEVKELP
jgi:hypothetical protein